MKIHLQSALAAILGVAALALALADQAIAHPTPAGVPYRWELQFDSGDLRLYIDPLQDKGYWYFTYRVTNRTGRVQVWAPSFTLFTDRGEILPAGVSHRVTTDLLDMIGDPLLEDQFGILGNILHGREHAKDGLVVWPADLLNVNQISMFVAGISGETARERNPVTREQVILYKTLHREYLIRGDARMRGSEPVEEVAESWVMR